MKRPLRSTALLTLLLLLAASGTPAMGQVVHGQLRDGERGRPVPGARLLLLGATGAVLDSARSDAAGAFRLRAPAAGEYVVHFQMDGWATVSSDPVRLEPGVTTDFTFPVPLIASAALQEMSDIIGMEPRLQAALPELCGEALRPWEAGLLVGRVRDAGGRPVPGAHVAVAAARGGEAVRATVASENGVYILCNVPAGTDIPIIAASPRGAVDTTRVEIRAGSAAWYDLPVGRRRR